MPLDTASILEVLRPVQDPELQKSLVELNMIRNVAIDGGKVSFTLVLTLLPVLCANLSLKTAKKPLNSCPVWKVLPWM